MKEYVLSFLSLVAIGVIGVAVGSLMVLTAPALALFVAMIDD